MGAAPAREAISRNDQHTPGPWRIAESVIAPRNDLIIEADAIGPSAWRIAVVSAVNSTVGQANAKLIATAPDLLAALEPFGDVAGEGSEDFPGDTKVVVTFGRTTYYALTLGDFRRASAAIAKAERST